MKFFKKKKLGVLHGFSIPAVTDLCGMDISLPFWLILSCKGMRRENTDILSKYESSDAYPLLFRNKNKIIFILY